MVSLKTQLLKIQYLLKFELILIFYLGVIFIQNEDGDVTDISADIIGPRKFKTD